jgi:hypothetical protein
MADGDTGNRRPDTRNIPLHCVTLYLNFDHAFCYCVENRTGFLAYFFAQHHEILLSST